MSLPGSHAEFPNDVARLNLDQLILGKFLPLQNSPDILLSVKNADYAYRVLLQQEVEADRLETHHWPRAEILKLRVA